MHEFVTHFEPLKLITFERKKGLRVYAVGVEQINKNIGTLIISKLVV